MSLLMNSLVVQSFVFVVRLFFYFFSNQISLLKFTSCVKFHFCSEIVFRDEIS